MNKKNVLISLSGIVAIIGIAAATYWFLQQDKTVTYSSLTASRGTVVKEVKATGPVKAAADVNLAWEKSGRIVTVGAKVGDKVSAGQTLLTLDNADLAASLAQAQASLDAASATYDQLKNGTRPETLAIKKLALEKAQTDLDNAYDNAIVALSDAYNKNEDAVKTYTDTMFSNPSVDSLKYAYLTSDSQLQNNLEADRKQINQDSASWNSEVSRLKAGATHEEIDAELIKAKTYLNRTSAYLNGAYDIIVASVNMPATTVSAYKTGINAARTEVSAATAALNAQTQTIKNLAINLDSVQEDYNLAVAGTRAEDLQAQAARVSQAQAAVQAIEVSIAKNSLRAPIAGTVTKLEGKKGEYASPGLTVATIISDSQYEIEIRLNEADVAKVSVGDAAAITLDAYGNQQFSGSVIAIDPAPSTGSDGLTGYKVRIQLTQNYAEIKTGMTANVSILADQKDNAIYLPQNALIRNNNDYYVIKADKTQSPVTIGLIGSDGKVEILSGLSENETVLVIGQ